MKKIAQWTNKNVLITGACGSIGKYLTKVLLKKNVRRITLLDNNENGIYTLSEEYKSKKKINVVLGDVRYFDSIDEHIRDVNILFHGAALKHVSIGENNPNEIINTNINGVKNIIDSSCKNNVDKVLFMSSDKAVNPTNVMGASKLMGEKLISAADLKNKRTLFFTTRFGNVIGSSGSALLKFLNQIKYNKQVTLTDKKMTRFMMTHKEAVNLLIDATNETVGGEIFVSKMKSINIEKLIQSIFFILENKFKLNIKKTIKIIGLIKGEKFYEELMSTEESSRSKEYKKYYVIKNDLYSNDKKKSLYSSENQKSITKKEIVEILSNDDVFIKLVNNEFF